jgi:hypothetical protein
MGSGQSSSDCDLRPLGVLSSVPTGSGAASSYISCVSSSFGLTSSECSWDLPCDEYLDSSSSPITFWSSSMSTCLASAAASRLCRRRVKNMTIATVAIPNTDPITGPTTQLLSSDPWTVETGELDAEAGIAADERGVEEEVDVGEVSATNAGAVTFADGTAVMSICEVWVDVAAVVARMLPTSVSLEACDSTATTSDATEVFEQ